MKKLAAASLTIALLSTSVAALAADTGPHASATKAGKKPATKESDNTCRGAQEGQWRTGYVASMGANWYGSNAITIALEEIDSDAYSIESSDYSTDTPEGREQYSTLFSAFLTNAPVAIYCIGKSRSTGRYSFTYVWVGTMATDPPQPR
ncbi:hypothetical protein [Bordetella bronchialis]|uniref:hypothetical protein n=1 Tax=Bordetella bronchialis TaxID=463025 RepID=UPI000ADC58F7|nr:hypothetical protein [Bordetella bronchialis]